MTTETAARVEQLRSAMKKAGVDAVVVRATDRYLNEYVPESESTRVWLTGFTGSAGDALITKDRAILFVDGRYTLQASQEAPRFEARTAPLGTSIEGAWMSAFAELAGQGVRVLGIESERVSQGLWLDVQAKAQAAGLTVKAFAPGLVDVLRNTPAPTSAPMSIGADMFAIDAKLSGRTVKERLALSRALFAEKKIDALLLTALDELAWVTNLRGTHFPYQATFRAIGLATADAVVVAVDAVGELPKAETGVRLLQGTLQDALSALGNSVRTVGIDARTAPAALVSLLHARGLQTVDVQSPFALARTKKTPEELRHMVAAFRRADDVVDDVQNWVCKTVLAKKRVTEKDVAQKTEELFKKSGAFGLSFKVISAAGKNGAVIHYSTPDEKRALKEGELFLLDTGAYYEGGYATDLTRTFLVGGKNTKASKRQKQLFTLVLKAAIAGMSARIPVGSTGEQLDALVRQPLWQAGLDYGHGTGHGVGVNVHESPPRVAIGARVALEAGQVFSIEPGVYLPDFGGVRIENLVTLVDDPETPPSGVARRFLRVKPLTFSPIDARLIDKTMLTAHERAFLTWFHKRGSKSALPPVA